MGGTQRKMGQPGLSLMNIGGGQDNPVPFESLLPEKWDSRKSKCEGRHSFLKNIFDTGFHTPVEFLFDRPGFNDAKFSQRE
jgi:hypothetical protein